MLGENPTALPATRPDVVIELEESVLTRALVSRRMVIVAAEFQLSVNNAMANGGRRMLMEALKGVGVQDDTDTAKVPEMV